MGIWLDILTLGATGQAAAARQKLALALPLALRSFVASSRGTREYVGELPRAVARFRYHRKYEPKALSRQPPRQANGGHPVRHPQGIRNRCPQGLRELLDCIG